MFYDHFNCRDIYNKSLNTKPVLTIKRYLVEILVGRFHRIYKNKQKQKKKTLNTYYTLQNLIFRVPKIFKIFIKF